MRVLFVRQPRRELSLSRVASHSFAFSITVSEKLLGQLDGHRNLILYTFAELEEN